MPKRELSRPSQVIDWLRDWGGRIENPAEMILIGSAGLLWHVHRSGRNDPLPDNSMDVDPITSSDEVAALAYEALIGSKFEEQHGWHVNLMPEMALDGLPGGWKDRAASATYQQLIVIVPAVDDLLVPKLSRAEPRDLAQAEFMAQLGLWASG